ncbi:MAG: methyl-accepting chemotaxis protein [Eubacterium sp.]|nr:methyl-accepting chemotaxis protein [Eubacterium sp.]
MKKLKVNIFIKLITVSLLFVIVPLSIMGIVGLTRFSGNIEQQTISNMESSVDIKVDLLQEVINGVKREAYSSAHDANAISVLTDMNNGEASKKAGEIGIKKVTAGNYLEDLLKKSNGMFENLFYANSRGVTIADALDGKALGTDVSSQDYYITASKTGETVVSDVVVSPSTKKSVMVIMVPLFDRKDAFIGVFGMQIDFDKLTEMLIEKTDGIIYNYSIINSKGIVIADENKEIVFKENLNETESQKTLLEKMKKGEASHDFYESKGVKKVMAYKMFKENGWYVTASCSVSDYMSSINSLRFFIIIVALICVAVAAVLVYLFSRSIAKPLKHLSEVAASISSGDLSKDVHISHSGDEIEKLSVDFSNMLGNLRGLITDVSMMSESVAASSEEMLNYQAEKMTENKLVSEEVANAVSELSHKSREIGEILSVIQSISEQTNLLSLNAAIEAARAGEQGKGFAVVAEEIRKLADQSGKSVNRINSIIKEVQTGVQHAVSEITKVKTVVLEQESALSETVHAFENIAEVVTYINANIKKVAGVSSELDSKAKEAGELIGEIAAICQETASGTEEAAASAQEQTSVIHQIAGASDNLSKLAVKLQQSIGKFKT